MFFNLPARKTLGLYIDFKGRCFKLRSFGKEFVLVYRWL